MPGILVKEGSGSGRLFEMEGARVSIGRAPDNDLQLDDCTVSRYHAVLTRRDGQWFINDLGSRNRTMVNGESVVAERLSHMDEIRLGNLVLSFLDPARALVAAEGGPPEAPRPEITQTRRIDHLRALLPPLSPRREGVTDVDLRLGYLLQLSELAATVRSIDALFGGLVDALREALPADRVVPMIESAGGALRPYLSWDGAFADSLEGLDIDVAALERARREGPTIARGGSGAAANVMCCPIRLGERSLGLIYCDAGTGSHEFAVEDMRFLFAICAGAAMAIDNIRTAQRMALKAQILSRQLRERYDMVGESEAMAAVYSFIRKVAPTEAGVLICGESGTGKELVARAIHHRSLRSDGPLEVVNCAAMPATLIESELFGHVRGAFTGALADKPGRFELADGGTLFLDEVAELPPQCQTKLLRVLEEGKIRRVGDTRDRTVDVRVISATNRDPDRAVAQGQLRNDLFYRLDRLRIVVPPLRERGKDVEILAHHFLEAFGRQCTRSLEGYGPEVLEVFRAYHWPGNVRELQNAVERMVIMADGPVLGLDLVPEDMKAAALAAGPGGVLPLSEVERRHILLALREANGNKKRTAEMLGIDRSTLYAKLNRYGIEP